jgi:hypothetical protein
MLIGQVEPVVESFSRVTTITDLGCMFNLPVERDVLHEKKSALFAFAGAQ